MVSAGQQVKINTHTAPTKSGNHFMVTKIKQVIGKRIVTEDSEPYFGYNIFDVSDIV